MEQRIRKAAVLGAGLMGSQIAAHLANVGIPSTLLDIVPGALTQQEEQRGLTLESPAVRNRLAEQGLRAALKARPAAFYTPEAAGLVTIGNFEGDLSRLPEADWVVEAVTERLDIKQQLYQRITPYLNDTAVLSSNTSGLSITTLSESLPQHLQTRFLGTHFFNPPRYAKLLELIPGPQTKPEVMQMMTGFGRHRLGKGVLRAKDTPNFIANRLGAYDLLRCLHVMQTEGYRVSEVDAVTGAAIGRAASAFRTADLVGLDALLHVVRNSLNALPNDAIQDVALNPAFVPAMVERGWLGNKTGQGFYKRVQTEAGRAFYEIDPETLEYRPPERFRTPSLQQLRQIEDVSKRLKTLVFAEDRAGQLAWQLLSASLCYAANLVPEIADDIVSIDQAMKWGFRWELGPFETWDALGLERVAKRLESEGRQVPPLVEQMLQAEHPAFYHQDDQQRLYFDLAQAKHMAIAPIPRTLQLTALKAREQVIRSNASASLIDLGDGVACLEFHSKLNAIGGDTVAMMQAAVEEVERNFAGLVIGNEAENFSAGANLALILLEIQNEEWDVIDQVVSAFQKANQALRHMSKPVVAAPAGMALAGGCEICLAADHIHAAAETYMGLVEVGVGLIPAGGGCLALLQRGCEGLPDKVAIDLFPLVQRIFETIGLAKVSTSAAEARQLGFLRANDPVTVYRDALLYNAKQSVLDLAAQDYTPPLPGMVRVAGRSGYGNFLAGLYNMEMARQISAYDRHIGRKLAYVLTGGDVPDGSQVSEQHLLDLEREAFLSLCGEVKTQERILHMLQNNKPLRN
ncbi:3-hydroxyacyl-CoA dehydrogenase/enoyl-CoA hydratase family protein [Candidatus Entotheonella palauensis]|uniref:3-hydroxyacyl-CoA dehydrogenase n=1 Tax=Candidatus Entotheonella gemina TaxID=1429439 RepID=W4MEA3_9BACT|nr:3-hydroxyacyl-CoA dehydrogenase/enoyl-CoA hydratase family protein [Candidatus Entotheonella palauensis]ETX08669.1 MAG: 3-hydroxyacyl-CoA dehydrogenase [Candidatus Entotheonella gemina]